MNSKTYYVYILASRKNGTLYVGVTNNIENRTLEHKENLNEGFTKKYSVHILVYFESFNDVNSAISREKQIKAGSRSKKIMLIEKENKDWVDLFTKSLE